MSYSKQGERFGRVTGHTLRRSPQSNHYTGQFVIMKRTSGLLSYDNINGQFQDILIDGRLQGSSDMVYSLNKQKRWELPGILKESICNDRDIHEDLDFKVLLVEHHLDSQSVFKSACTGLYESKTSRPERLPRKKYAHALDLHKRERSNASQQEALRRHVNKLRCTKNRGGKKVNWRGVMDAMLERRREEEQRQKEEEEDTPQLCYEVGYGRPENKYPWRPEMKMNTVTSKRSMGTKQRHKGNTEYYLEEAFDMEGDIQDDIYEEVRSHSEAESHLQEDASDSALIIMENHPKLTFGEALCGLTKTRQCKKRRRNKSNSTTAQSAKRGLTSNQATSESVKVHDKGSVVYDPDGIIYKPLPKEHPRPNLKEPPRPKKARKRRKRAAKSLVVVTSNDDDEQLPVEEDAAKALVVVTSNDDDEQVPVEEDASNVENLSLECLQVDHESLKPSRLEADFGLAYTEAECKPRKFAVQVNDGDTDLASDPTNSVYALFEYSRDDATMIKCTELEDAQSWQVVKKGVHMSQRRAGHSRSRYLSSDIPTVREALGWDCRISTADEAYREITGGQTHQAYNDSAVRDLAMTSSTCGICCESISSNATDGASELAPSVGGAEATVLTSCGHCFCNECWRQYLSSGVEQGATNITCPEYKCKTRVDPVTTMAFLSPAQFHAYYRSSRDTTLARSAQCHTCPNPLCGRVTWIDGGAASSTGSRDETRISDAAKMVRCECRWLWCTDCMEEGHWPASCKQAKEYRVLLRKKLGENKTPFITHVQVKRCPGCKTRWEKNGGCPSMICGSCRLNFCWICLRTYDVHDLQICRKSVIDLEAIYLDFRTRSKDAMLELAVVHHKQRFGSALRKDWFAAAKLASRSAMVNVSGPKSAGDYSSPMMTSDVVMTTASATNHQPLTWARTQDHLEMMNRRAEESYEIASFCHESNFVLEHMAFLFGSLPRRQRKMKMWRTMSKLRFIVQNLEETLGNLSNVKRSESEATMDRLCNMMHAGKECLRKLARSTVTGMMSQRHDIKE